MERPKLKGRTILIVEDEPLIAIDIAEAFQKAGAEVTTTTTLRQALKRAVVRQQYAKGCYSE